MDPIETLRAAVDGSEPGQLFGEPVVHGDIVLLPVAKIARGGGGGGGTGRGESGSGDGGGGTGRAESGSGGGFGTAAKGLGVFMLKDGQVSWHPAVDVTRIVLGAQLVAVAALLVARSVLRNHSRKVGRRASGAARPR